MQVISFNSTRYFFEGQTEDAESRAFQTGSGSVSCFVRGDLGGGTLTFQLSDDGTNWVSIPGCPNAEGDIAAYSITAANYLAGEDGCVAPFTNIGPGLYMRAVLTGSTDADIWVSFNQSGGY